MFEASLIYTVSSRTANVTQLHLVFTKQKQKSRAHSLPSEESPLERVDSGVLLLTGAPPTGLAQEVLHNGSTEEVR